MIELVEHSGINIATKRKESNQQYRIFLDGRFVGYIGWHDGSKVLLTRRVGPIDQKRIEEYVEAEMNRTVATKVVPDVPKELLQPKVVDDGRANADDFD